MSLRYSLELVAQRLADVVFRFLPRSRPTRQALQACRIIAHRGEHDNRQVFENTLAAFEIARDAGLWGIEIDVRWTRDYVPVVLHDPDTSRVFGIDLVIAETDFDELRQRVPQVPSLAEVVSRFGGCLHLMIELKADQLQDIERKRGRLRQVLTALSPVDDFHFLALALELFAAVDHFDGKVCLPVAELNPGRLSAEVLERDFSGISGHYLLINRKLLRRHRQRGQKVGTGFVASRYCLYRELNRGVDWIFTNHGLKLESIRMRLLENA